MEQRIESYRDLKVWQSAMTLAEDCYRHTKEFPKEEIYMTSQMRRSAVSIAANVAEDTVGKTEVRSFNFCAWRKVR